VSSRCSLPGIRIGAEDIACRGKEGMIAGVVGIGMIAGLLSAIVMLAAGGTFAVALSAYAFVGLILTATTATLMVNLEATSEEHSI
jgi:hypothetical protein